MLFYSFSIKALSKKVNEKKYRTNIKKKRHEWLINVRLSDPWV